MKVKCLFAGMFLVCVTADAQMEVDHPIQLTGSGTNAKISGIQSVANTQDAASVGSLQSGSFVYGMATGNSNNFILNISPAINAYQPGMVFNFISNQTVAGPTTLNVNNLGAIPVTKSVNLQLAGCEIANGQVVTVVYDGTNFQMTSAISLLGSPPTPANAGPDQLNVPGHVAATLAANTPASGTGVWSIISGSGGSIANVSDPTSTFSGQPSTTYLLQWTISNSCGVSIDTVEISFSASCYVPGSQTFNYTGGLQQFTVGCDVSSVAIEAWGAQGGTTTGQSESGDYTGGLGADIKGTFNVNTGQVITVLAGGEGTAAPGSSCTSGGGGGSWVLKADTLILVAGGGGGGFMCTYYGGNNGGSGNSGNNGGNGIPSGSAQAGQPGGSGGNGGVGCYGGGGGGWLSAGTLNCGGGAAGEAYPGVSVAGGGGYGGGGGGYNSGCCGGSGGGGGYSGGSGGTEDGCAGGGGGSYNIGTNQTNTAGVQSGNGKVTFTW